MKLNALQWSWIIATGIFFVAVVFDILGVLNVPGHLLIATPILLLLVSWYAGPSLKELSRAHRRG